VRPLLVPVLVVGIVLGVIPSALRATDDRDNRHVAVAPAAAAGTAHFAAVADIDDTANSSAVLNAIKTSGADLTLAVGDLSYGTTGQEQTWCDFVTSRLGAG